MHTIQDVIDRLPKPGGESLPAPTYNPDSTVIPSNVCLGVEAMKRHITDEGWQLVYGLEHAGYKLHGFNLGPSLNDVKQIVELEQPTTLFIQDKREWDGLTAGKNYDRRYAFKNIQCLKQRDDIFKVTVIKDAHHRQEYHRESAEEMGVHAWVTYYSPRIVNHLAPYTRLKHIIRTYHTVNPDHVPEYLPGRRLPYVISGALGKVYPLRTRLINEKWRIPGLVVLKHPGYHTPGPFTPSYLKELSRFKVSICTTSIFAYSLRKLIESTACGCKVITNLPQDDILPYIDKNLIRVRPDASTSEIWNILKEQVASYNPEEQEHYSKLALQHYNFKTMGIKLASDIEKMRVSYN